MVKRQNIRNKIKMNDKIIENIKEKKWKKNGKWKKGKIS